MFYFYRHFRSTPFHTFIGLSSHFIFSNSSSRFNGVRLRLLAIQKVLISGAHSMDLQNGYPFNQDRYVLASGVDTRRSRKPTTELRVTGASGCGRGPEHGPKPARSRSDSGKMCTVCEIQCKFQFVSSVGNTILMSCLIIHMTLMCADMSSMCVPNDPENMCVMYSVSYVGNTMLMSTS